MQHRSSTPRSGFTTPMKTELCGVVRSMTRPGSVFEDEMPTLWTTSTSAGAARPPLQVRQRCRITLESPSQSSL